VSDGNGNSRIDGLLTETQLLILWTRCRDEGMIRPLRMIPPGKIIEYSKKKVGSTWTVGKLTKKLALRIMKSEALQEIWNAWLVEWMPEFYEALFEDSLVIGQAINRDMKNDDKRNPALTKLWLEHRIAFLQALGIQEQTVQEHVVKHMVSQEDGKNIDWKNQRMPDADDVPLMEPTARRLLDGVDGSDT